MATAGRSFYSPSTEKLACNIIDERIILKSVVFQNGVISSIELKMLLCKGLKFRNHHIMTSIKLVLNKKYKVPQVSRDSSLMAQRLKLIYSWYSLTLNKHFLLAKNN